MSLSISECIGDWRYFSIDLSGKKSFLLFIVSLVRYPICKMSNSSKSIFLFQIYLRLVPLCRSTLSWFYRAIVWLLHSPTFFSRYRMFYWLIWAINDSLRLKINLSLQIKRHVQLWKIPSIDKIPKDLFLLMKSIWTFLKKKIKMTPRQSTVITNDFYSLMKDLFLSIESNDLCTYRIKQRSQGNICSKSLMNIIRIFRNLYDDLFISCYWIYLRSLR